MIRPMSRWLRICKVWLIQRFDNKLMITLNTHWISTDWLTDRLVGRGSTHRPFKGNNTYVIRLIPGTGQKIWLFPLVHCCSWARVFLALEFNWVKLNNSLWCRFVMHCWPVCAGAVYVPRRSSGLHVITRGIWKPRRLEWCWWWGSSPVVPMALVLLNNLNAIATEWRWETALD